jgi:hypothetical protein
LRDTAYFGGGVFDEWMPSDVIGDTLYTRDGMMKATQPRVTMQDLAKEYDVNGDDEVESTEISETLRRRSAAQQEATRARMRSRATNGPAAPPR